MNIKLAFDDCRHAHYLLESRDVAAQPVRTSTEIGKWAANVPAVAA